MMQAIEDKKLETTHGEERVSANNQRERKLVGLTESSDGRRRKIKIDLSTKGARSRGGMKNRPQEKEKQQ